MPKSDNNVVIPNYPSNTKSTNNSGDEVRVIEKVISGTAETRRRSPWLRFISTFIGEDLSVIKDTFVNDMIIPGIKEGIIGGMEMMFFGVSNRGGRVRMDGRRVNVDRASYNMVNYGSYSKGNHRDRRDYYDNHYASLDEVTFDTRGDAELVLDALRADITRYNEATESAYYQYAGISNNDYTANDRGWTNLDMNIRPRRIRGGRYVLDLPRPEQLA